jgi:thiamine kinase-like enzyme
MESERFVKELNGYSGCKIYLYENQEGILFVRKISPNKNYNPRLKKQAEKQKYFYDFLMSENVKTPKIFQQGEKEGLYFFDMEYIPGKNLIEIIPFSSQEELKKIVYVLIDLIRKMKELKRPSFISIKEKIKNKVSKINSKLNIDAPFLNEIITSSENFLDVEETFCHGDLTFENILYDQEKEEYFLIDFLDSFIENYWFDLVKLFQDIEGKWYIIRNRYLDKKNIEIKMDFIGKKIKKEFETDPYWTKHNLLLKLNFARILPYAKKEDFELIIDIIKNIS